MRLTTALTWQPGSEAEHNQVPQHFCSHILWQSIGIFHPEDTPILPPPPLSEALSLVETFQDAMRPSLGVRFFHMLTSVFYMQAQRLAAPMQGPPVTMGLGGNLHAHTADRSSSSGLSPADAGGTPPLAPCKDTHA